MRDGTKIIYIRSTYRPSIPMRLAFGLGTRFQSISQLMVSSQRGGTTNIAGNEWLRLVDTHRELVRIQNLSGSGADKTIFGGNHAASSEPSSRSYLHQQSIHTERHRRRGAAPWCGIRMLARHRPNRSVVHSADRRSGRTELR